MLIRVGRSMGTSLLIAICKFAALPVLAYAMQPVDFGVYALITSMLSFGIAFLGLGVRNYTYRMVPGRPIQEAMRLMNTSTLFELASASLILAVTLPTGLADTVLRALNVDHYRTAFGLGAVWLLVDLVAINLRNFLLARERTGNANIVDLLRQVGWMPLALAAWVMIGRLEVHSVVVVLVISSLLSSAAGAAYAAMVLRASAAFEFSVHLASLRPALRYSLPLLLPVVATPLMRLADRGVIAASRSLEELAAFTLLTACAGALYGASALSVEAALLPKAVRAANLGRLGRSRSILWAIVTISLLTFVLGAAAIAVAIFAIGRDVYPQYEGAFTLFPMVCGGYLLMIASRAPHNALLLAGRTRVLAVIDAGALLVALAVDLALVPRLGISGAVLASIAGFGVGGALKMVMSRAWNDISLREVVVPLSILRDEDSGGFTAPNTV